MARKPPFTARRDEDWRTKMPNTSQHFLQDYKSPCRATHDRRQLSARFGMLHVQGVGGCQPRRSLLTDSSTRSAHVEWLHVHLDLPRFDPGHLHGLPNQPIQAICLFVDDAHQFLSITGTLISISESKVPAAPLMDVSGVRSSCVIESRIRSEGARSPCWPRSSRPLRSPAHDRA